MKGAARARLLFWLGPWRDPQAAPQGVMRRELSLPCGGRAWLYQPAGRSPVGSVLVSEGLNPHGPADPRMDRLMRVLGGAGLMACVPFYSEFMQLELGRRADRELRESLDALRAAPDHPPVKTGLFSISFGIVPAAELAADAGVAEQLGGLVAFGGYAEPVATLRYAMGEPVTSAPAPDPLSLPAVAINLLEGVSPAPQDLAAVKRAWVDLARHTWGNVHLSARRRWEPLARELGAKLEPAERTLYLRGCGLTDDALPFWLEAMQRSDLRRLDPRPRLARVRLPVHLIHGVGDDVVPHTQLEAVAAALPQDTVLGSYRTGLYDHTRAAGGGSLGSLGTAVRELTAFHHMIDAVLGCATAHT